MFLRGNKYKKGGGLSIWGKKYIPLLEGDVRLYRPDSGGGGGGGRGGDRERERDRDRSFRGDR